jgi:hypothetical protein
MTTYLQIATQQVASQELATVVNGQACGISLREMDGKQYFSLTLNSTSICKNVLIQHNTTLVNAPYSKLVGDFIVIDTQGVEPPQYTGWDSRWVLLYKD